MSTLGIFASSHKFASSGAGITFDMLLIGGGGGAGTKGSKGIGGAGAGGGKNYETSVTLTASNQYTITVGAGGASGANGGTSSVVGTGVSYDAIGGGHGGRATTSLNNVGNDFGGGASGRGDSTNSFKAGGQPNSTYQIGYGGAQSRRNASGGGAGVQNGQSTGAGLTDPWLNPAPAAYGYGGAGGDGLQNSITGTAIYYGGGGGGGGIYGYAIGGQGGGGNGGRSLTDGTNGTDGLGGGGGGNRRYGQTTSGGDGVVILRVLTSDYTGTITGSPTVTTDGSHTVIKYLNSGTYTA